MDHNSIEKSLHKILTTAHSHEKKQRFKKTKKGYNFACPVCGDSHKDPGKKRAWVLTEKAEPYFFCHHECGGMSIDKFFGEFGERYEQDLFQFFDVPIKTKSQYKYNPREISLNETLRLSVDIDLICQHYGFTRIDEVHPVYKYLQKRKLEQFKDWFAFWPKAKRLIIFNPTEIPSPEMRFNEKGYYPYVSYKVLSFQARDLTGQASAKYLTYTLEKIRGDMNLVWDPKPGTEEYVKTIYNTFGSMTNNRSKPVYVFEGPIDAMMIDNSIALLGASKQNKKLDEQPHVHYVFDNDTTGREKATEKLKIGRKVLNWSSFLDHYGLPSETKDMNEVVVKLGYVPDIQNHFV